MGTKVLLVEDDPSVRELLRVLLKGEGYEIVEAGDGNEALRKVKIEEPQLLILDLMMPNVDGEAVIRKLRDDPQHSDLPVVVVTGRFEALDRLKDLIGDDNVFGKPFEPTQLMDRIGQIVGAGS